MALDHERIFRQAFRVTTSRIWPAVCDGLDVQEIETVNKRLADIIRTYQDPAVSEIDEQGMVCGDYAYWVIKRSVREIPGTTVVAICYMGWKSSWTNQLYQEKSLDELIDRIEIWFKRISC